MEAQVEMEICANCKKEIPHTNYVMHTAHCARNISLCSTCKEPIPKTDFEKHTKMCKAPPVRRYDPPTNLEKSGYFKSRKDVEDKKAAERQVKRLERLERLVATNTVGHTGSVHTASSTPIPRVTHPLPVYNYSTPVDSSKASLLPCQYCELELPKLDLEDHESYCGARTEKCQDCGEIVMFRDRNAHKDSNHRLHNGYKPKPTSQQRHPINTFENLNFASLGLGGPSIPEKLETSREIARRLDCKTEYIRNLLHDSASITASLRSTGAIPRNRGVVQRRPNPPTEIVIPCEFCGTPIPHAELIEHETGCRPDLARYNPRRRSSSPDVQPMQGPGSPDVDIPCEFCSDLIPASQFLNHQATCNCN